MLPIWFLTNHKLLNIRNISLALEKIKKKELAYENFFLLFFM